MGKGLQGLTGYIVVPAKADPYAVSWRLEDGANCLCDNKHQWLWVSAFAGTT
jgi:hypothetical protein